MTYRSTVHSVEEGRSMARFRPAAVLLTLLVSVVAACHDAPTAPAWESELAIAKDPGDAPFPPLAGPGRIYAFSRSLWGWGAGGGVMEYTRQSRYVLYDDGSFALQMWLGAWGAGEYRGTYEMESDGRIDFAWEGWSRAGPWGATGTLSKDTLSVRYNLVMMMTDFEDAEYILDPRD